MLSALAALLVAAFAYRALLVVAIDPWSADDWLEWFTRPNGLALPLVLAGSAILARRRLAPPLPDDARPALALGTLAPAALAMLWWRATGSPDPLVLSLALLATSAVAGRFGTAGVRRLALPLLFLLLALAPPPRLVAEALWLIQSQSARAVSALTQGLGAPVLREGIVLRTPTEVFGIVESCAALGMLVVLVALSLLLRERIAPLGRRSWWLVVLAPLVALAVNLLRITSIVLYPRLNDLHHLGQWAVLLALGIGVLLGVRRLLARRRGPARPGATGPPAWTLPRVRPAEWAALALVAVLSWLPAPPASLRPAPAPLTHVPPQHEGWVSTETAIDRTFLGLVQFRRIVSRRYSDGVHQVELFVGDGPGRHPGSSPFSAKTILPGLRWIPIPRDATTPAPALPVVPMQTAWVARDGQRWWVAQWRFGDPGVLRESLRQLFALDASPFHAPPTRRIVRIAAPLDPARPDDVAPAQQTVARFASDFEAVLFAERQGLPRDSR